LASPENGPLGFSAGKLASPGNGPLGFSAGKLASPGAGPLGFSAGKLLSSPGSGALGLASSLRVGDVFVFATRGVYEVVGADEIAACTARAPDAIPELLAAAARPHDAKRAVTINRRLPSWPSADVADRYR
jgi:hypothetical protein